MAINAWEKRKLGDVTKLITKGTTPRKQNGQGTINFIKVENISKGGNISVTNKISFEEHQGYLARSVLQENDILFSIAGSLGRTAIISKSLLPANTNQALAIIRLGSGDVKFVATYLSGTAVNEYIKRNPTTGAQPNISLTQVASLHIDWPCLDEQRTIAKLFSKVNNLIAATQGKLDQLEMVKKALLQHLFDQSMRFKGYSDPWEKRKLGDLGQVAMNKRIYKDQTSSTGDVPFYKIGTFGKEADSFISRELFEKYKKMYPFPEAGDILISASGSIGRKLVYDGEDAYFQDSNIIWIKHDERLANSFLNQFLSIVHWNGTEGTTIKRLYNKNVLTTKINIPSRKEQDTIGSCLTIFDNLIAATQSKLSGLESLKKALLQGLFI
ncbi:restriction endonuclease subunit S [Lacticaseibacillus sp. BCRC 81376]|uniref:restriction endonuclease subunit S n=1 Tax=Lacticaseibacillus sp. BCRC 81376 TaxID=3036496 RepID=UPI00240EB16A|nr:restriction endonuclease subunit S [Lacticaseibacillus sp. BCRC 81376]MDG3060942.1 restriction endonuclease subunit S [Lacticaseibacillus sp. BCRC 81376]